MVDNEKKIEHITTVLADYMTKEELNLPLRYEYNEMYDQYDIYENGGCNDSHSVDRIAECNDDAAYRIGRSCDRRRFPRYTDDRRG